LQSAAIRAQDALNSYTYFTGHALTELAIAKRKLRSAGSDLKLINCSSEVEDSLRVPIFQALVN